jgi:hypothetical protein
VEEGDVIESGLQKGSQDDGDQGYDERPRRHESKAMAAALM